MSGVVGMVSPWYHPWSYFNEPTRLLLAAACLWLGKLEQFRGSNSSWLYAGPLCLFDYDFQCVVRPRVEILKAI